MLRTTICAVLAACLTYGQSASQSLNRPPAEVDRALRARITEFYEDHVKQRFRQAEELVAEDTKEFFYSHNKPQYLSFEIRNIDYSDNFTKAKATILCEQYVMFPGFADKPVKIPTPSTWKLENGKWFWYVDPEALRQGPFGKMTAGPHTASAAPVPAVVPGDINWVMKQVKADRQQLLLAPGESALINIANGAPGVMTLTVLRAPTGLNASLDHKSLKAGERAVLLVKAEDDAKAGTINVRVDQTQEVIPIRVTIK
jgi:hypothetical protein